MVSGGVDGEETVGASWETGGNIGGEDTTCRSSVQTLEELELRGIWGGGVEDTVDSLDDDVGMSLNDTLAVQLLWCGEVVGVGVNEEAGLEVLDGHLDGEFLVLADVL
jgi:hypothetical protein